MLGDVSNFKRRIFFDVRFGHTPPQHPLTDLGSLAGSPPDIPAAHATPLLSAIFSNFGGFGRVG